MNVYAREAAAAAEAAAASSAAQVPVPGAVPLVDGITSSGGGGNAVRAPLRRNGYAPLAVWRELRYVDAEGREAAASYNRMRVRFEG